MDKLNFEIKVADDLFHRNEGNDTISIFSIDSGLKFLENITSEIFNLIIDGFTPAEIFKQLVETYPNVPKEQIYKDFLSLLSSLKENNIIEYEGELSMNDSYLGICNETDYKLLEDFVKNNFNYVGLKEPKLIAMIDKNYYNAMNLRSVSLYATEIYFIKKKNEKIEGLISIGGFDQNIQTVSITNIIAEDDNIDTLKEIYNYLENYITNLGVNKFKVTLIMNTNHEGLIKLIKDFGFIEEALLENEYKNYDVAVFKKNVAKETKDGN